MPPKIKTISLRLPFNVGGVNCYLVETRNGYVLIDTGTAEKRAQVENELAATGCQPGNLVLILLTHGDFDHSSNAAFLRAKYGAKIAIHQNEVKVVESGNMLLSRKNRSLLSNLLLPFFKLNEPDRFQPDFCVEDGDDLSKYGFNARVFYTPGHSAGSISIAAADSAASPDLVSALFCGDLLINTHKPVINSLMDDLAVANASVEKLASLNIATVYPGHGEPFPMELFLKSWRSE